VEQALESDLSVSLIGFSVLSCHDPFGVRQMKFRHRINDRTRRKVRPHFARGDSALNYTVRQVPPHSDGAFDHIAVLGKHHPSVAREKSLQELTSGSEVERCAVHPSQRGCRT
jgi:hypothetical protein